MYCTGGIRCDVYSALLRQKGFKNLYTLHGGIQHYLKEEGNEHWKGSLFVFDGRMAINPALEGQLKEGE
jgi:predicted sulfurtransferase